MTCKDCLHYEACESMLRALGYIIDGDGDDANERCDTFADRTRYVMREKGEWTPNMQFDLLEGHSVTVGYHCNKCGFWGYDEQNFCPNCGSDMRIRLCPHCKKPVIPSGVDGYAWQCLDCDEDFFDIECYKAEKE